MREFLGLQMHSFLSLPQYETAGIRSGTVYAVRLKPPCAFGATLWSVCSEPPRILCVRSHPDRSVSTRHVVCWPKKGGKCASFQAGVCDWNLPQECATARMHLKGRPMERKIRQVFCKIFLFVRELHSLTLYPWEDQFSACCCYERSNCTRAQ